MCDESDYVIGFRTRVEPTQNNCNSCDEDDTAMNGIELICKNGKVITSSYEYRGIWAYHFSLCPNNQTVRGFVYGYDVSDFPDKSTMNAIRLICSDNSEITSTEGEWASYVYAQNCPMGVIIGLRTQIDPYIGENYDDTCINNVEFICKLI